MSALVNWIPSDFLSLRKHLGRLVLFNRLNLSVYVISKNNNFNSSGKSVKDEDFKAEIIHHLAKDSFVKKQLIMNEYLVNRDYKKILIEKLRQYTAKTAFPINLLRVMTTFKCNLNCDYCKVINNATNYNGDDYILLNKFIPVVSYVSEISQNCCIYVHFTGGEPMIQSDRLLSLLDNTSSVLSGRKYCIVIGTNATLISDRFCKKIKNYKNCRVIVSCDGIAECHNKTRVTLSGKPTYEMVSKGIEKLVKNDIPFGISMVMGSHNINNLDESIDNIVHKFNPESIGVNYLKSPSIKNRYCEFSISPVDYADAIWEQHLKWRDFGVYFELLQRRLNPFIMKRFRLFDCGSISGTSLNLSPNGKLSTCKTSTVLNRDVIDTVDKSFFNSKRSRSPIFNDTCLNCDGIAICGNGCMYQAKLNYGNKLDKSSCLYTNRFISLFLDEAVRQFSENECGFLTKYQRLRIQGNCKSQEGTLRWSIGHSMPLIKWSTIRNFYDSDRIKINVEY